MPLILSNTLVNGENADATEVQGNFDQVESYVNTNVINSDGSVAMTAPLLLTSGDPTQPNHAANKDYVDNILPVGIMMPWPATVAPAGGTWMLCNGASLSQTAYTELFGILGLNYGATTVGNFLLPNMVGRMIIGYNPADSVRHFDDIGHTGGSWNVPVQQHLHSMLHTHPINHNHPTATSGNNSPAMTHSHSVTGTAAAAGAHDHDFSYLATQQDDGGSGARIIGYTSGGLHAVVSTEPAHTHTVSGTTGPGDLGSHSHSIDLPVTSGLSSGASSAPTTANFGVDNAESQPPFLVLSYIIRAK